MQVVREKMEAKITAFPYNLSSDLYDYLAQDVVNQCLKCIPPLGLLMKQSLVPCLAVLSVSTLPVSARDISPPVATSTLALSIANPCNGTDGSTTTVQSIPTPVATSKPRVKPTVQPDPAPTRQNARILERGYGYRKPDTIHFLTLCQVEEHRCPKYSAFATGSLTWHEAAKSNNAAEAKEADQLEVMALSAFRLRQNIICS